MFFLSRVFFSVFIIFFFFFISVVVISSSSVVGQTTDLIDIYTECTGTERIISARALPFTDTRLLSRARIIVRRFDPGCHLVIENLAVRYVLIDAAPQADSALTVRNVRCLMDGVAELPSGKLPMCIVIQGVEYPGDIVSARFIHISNVSIVVSKFVRTGDEVEGLNTLIYVARNIISIKQDFIVEGCSYFVDVVDIKHVDDTPWAGMHTLMILKLDEPVQNIAGSFIVRNNRVVLKQLTSPNDVYVSIALLRQLGNITGGFFLTQNTILFDGNAASATSGIFVRMVWAFEQLGDTPVISIAGNEIQSGVAATFTSSTARVESSFFIHGSDESGIIRVPLVSVENNTISMQLLNRASQMYIIQFSLIESVGSISVSSNSIGFSLVTHGGEGGGQAFYVVMFNGELTGSSVSGAITTNNNLLQLRDPPASGETNTFYTGVMMFIVVTMSPLRFVARSGGITLRNNTIRASEFNVFGSSGFSCTGFQSNSPALDHIGMITIDGMCLDFAGVNTPSAGIDISAVDMSAPMINCGGIRVSNYSLVLNNVVASALWTYVIQLRSADGLGELTLKHFAVDISRTAVSGVVFIIGIQYDSPATSPSLRRVPLVSVEQGSFSLSQPFDDTSQLIEGTIFCLVILLNQPVVDVRSILVRDVSATLVIRKATGQANAGAIMLASTTDNVDTVVADGYSLNVRGNPAAAADETLRFSRVQVYPAYANGISFSFDVPPSKLYPAPPPTHFIVANSQVILTDVYSADYIIARGLFLIGAVDGGRGKDPNNGAALPPRADVILANYTVRANRVDSRSSNVEMAACICFQSLSNLRSITLSNVSMKAAVSAGGSFVGIVLKCRSSLSRVTSISVQNVATSSEFMTFPRVWASIQNHAVSFDSSMSDIGSMSVVHLHAQINAGVVHPEYIPSSFFRYETFILVISGSAQRFGAGGISITNCSLRTTQVQGPFYVRSLAVITDAASQISFIPRIIIENVFISVDANRSGINDRSSADVYAARFLGPVTDVANGIFLKNVTVVARPPNEVEGWSRAWVVEISSNENARIRTIRAENCNVTLLPGSYTTGDFSIKIGTISSATDSYVLFQRCTVSFDSSLEPVPSSAHLVVAMFISECSKAEANFAETTIALRDNRFVVSNVYAHGLAGDAFCTIANRLASRPVVPLGNEMVLESNIIDFSLVRSSNFTYTIVNARGEQLVSSGNEVRLRNFSVVGNESGIFKIGVDDLLSYMDPQLRDPTTVVAGITVRFDNVTNAAPNKRLNLLSVFNSAEKLPEFWLHMQSYHRPMPVVPQNTAGKSFSYSDVHFVLDEISAGSLCTPFSCTMLAFGPLTRVSAAGFLLNNVSFTLSAPTPSSSFSPSADDVEQQQQQQKRQLLAESMSLASLGYGSLPASAGGMLFDIEDARLGFSSSAADPRLLLRPQLIAIESPAPQNRLNHTRWLFRCGNWRAQAITQLQQRFRAGGGAMGEIQRDCSVTRTLLKTMTPTEESTNTVEQTETLAATESLLPTRTPTAIGTRTKSQSQPSATESLLESRSGSDATQTASESKYNPFSIGGLDAQTAAALFAAASGSAVAASVGAGVPPTLAMAVTRSLSALRLAGCPPFAPSGERWIEQDPGLLWTLMPTLGFGPAAGFYYRTACLGFAAVLVVAALASVFVRGDLSANPRAVTEMRKLDAQRSALEEELRQLLERRAEQKAAARNRKREKERQRREQQNHNGDDDSNNSSGRKSGDGGDSSSDDDAEPIEKVALSAAWRRKVETAEAIRKQKVPPWKRLPHFGIRLLGPVAGSYAAAVGTLAMTIDFVDLFIAIAPFLVAAGMFAVAAYRLYSGLQPTGVSLKRIGQRGGAAADNLNDSPLLGGGGDDSELLQQQMRSNLIVPYRLVPSFLVRDVPVPTTLSVVSPPLSSPSISVVGDDDDDDAAPGQEEPAPASNEQIAAERILLSSVGRFAFLGEVCWYRDPLSAVVDRDEEHDAERQRRENDEQQQRIKKKKKDDDDEIRDLLRRFHDSSSRSSSSGRGGRMSKKERRTIEKKLQKREEQHQQMLRDKQQMASPPHVVSSLLITSTKFFNQLIGPRQEVTCLGEGAVDYESARVRHAPLFIVYCVLLSVVPCIAQGISIGRDNEPAICRGALVINVLCGVVASGLAVWLRPYIIPLRNVVMVLVEIVCCCVGILAFALTDVEQRVREQRELQQQQTSSSSSAPSPADGFGPNSTTAAAAAPSGPAAASSAAVPPLTPDEKTRESLSQLLLSAQVIVAVVALGAAVALGLSKLLRMYYLKRSGCVVLSAQAYWSKFDAAAESVDAGLTARASATAAGGGDESKKRRGHDGDDVLLSPDTELLFSPTRAAAASSAASPAAAASPTTPRRRIVVRKIIRRSIALQEADEAAAGVEMTTRVDPVGKIVLEEL